MAGVVMFEKERIGFRGDEVSLSLPDVTGLDVFDAACEYAANGIPVAPFDPDKGKGKSCWNLVGYRVLSALERTMMYLEREWLTPHAVRYLRADKSRSGYTAHRLEGGSWRLELPDGTERVYRGIELAAVEQQIANVELSAT